MHGQAQVNFHSVVFGVIGQGERVPRPARSVRRVPERSKPLAGLTRGKGATPAYHRLHDSLTHAAHI